ncbi:peroxisomal membrane protein PEX13-like [Xenia sp. Carnegie-2017]|uniref:peroxisomal membrane protein PEX13-like n=1 Tax=Xenia sp. Carnegie-2017 TaxID=2897299 RepID=UPI001F04D3F0|nr:peroxisomal membrane protein PEX13-like [Xenia sp. Carnegie-2017]
MFSSQTHWEIPQNNFRNPSLGPNNTIYGPSRGLRPVKSRKMDESEKKKAPTVPPRPPNPRDSRNAYSNYGYGGNYGAFNSGYVNPYSGMYGNGYAGFNGYGGYNSYNSMYGGGYGSDRYGYSNNSSNSFVEQAEQNSQIAFDSVHSIVRAFGSIAMMLESTFFAVHSSFRAVLGVADHFTRLRENLVQIVGENFVIKWVRNIFRKIMVLIGLRNANSVEEVWNEIKLITKDHRVKQGQAWKSWPLLLFFGVVLGTPWLIWRILSSLGDNNVNDWITGEGEHVLGEVLYDFVAERDDELSITAGECLRIAPKQKQPRIRGWLLATVDGNTKGIVPANYIKILGFNRGSKAMSSNDVQKTTDSSQTNEINGNSSEPSRATDFEEVYDETLINNTEQDYNGLYNHAKQSLVDIAKDPLDSDS